MDFSISKLVNVFLSSISYTGKEECHILLADAIFSLISLFNLSTHVSV